MRFVPTTQHPYQWKEDKEDPWQGSTPERSSVEIYSRGAYPKVATSSIQIETHSNAHICLCNESPCPMLNDKSISSYTRLSSCILKFFLKSYQVRGCRQ